MRTTISTQQNKSEELDILLFETHLKYTYHVVLLDEPSNDSGALHKQ
jgi:hypothetical protein